MVQLFLAVLHIFDHLQTMHLVNKFMVVLDYCRNTLSYYQTICSLLLLRSSILVTVTHHGLLCEVLRLDDLLYKCLSLIRVSPVSLAATNCYSMVFGNHFLKHSNMVKITRFLFQLGQVLEFHFYLYALDVVAIVYCN